MKVDIYSDVVCPWCYIGERRFARALSGFPEANRVEVVFRPYQLDPSAPATAVPLAEYLERRFGRRIDGMLGRVSAEAEREGIAIAWDQALSANTRTAHRLLELAEREHGAAVQRALAERLFDLYFTRGGNIADTGQLADAAASAGMDGDRVRAYLESDEGLPELQAAFDEARRLGIRAVPTFVIDERYVVEGAQPVATFLEVLREAAKAENAASAANAEPG
ncbi:MAG: DsbA family oxidoreductase [Vicinamibacterales bacterium]